ncbi:MAG: gliding motility-associated C-terminal domain-containing protein, partial [Bacteroidota bacterium]
HQYVKSSTWDPLRVCLIVMDSLGCSDTLCHSFLLHPEIDVIIPEGFSPNGDSDNESLLISGMWAFPRSEWLVFNRWGQVVFRSDSDHKNSWDGRCNAPECNGALLPEGVYYLVFHYNDGVRSVLSKNIYLKR